MEKLVCLSELLERCLLSMGYSPEDMALLKEIPFESVTQVEQFLKELENVEQK